MVVFAWGESHLVHALLASRPQESFLLPKQCSFQGQVPQNEGALDMQ